MENHMPEDNKAKFKQILSKLPEDKRKLLYKRLHDMPESKREAYIDDFVKKYYSKPKKQAHQKNTSQSIILGILSALLIVGILYFVYVILFIFILPLSFSKLRQGPCSHTVKYSKER